MKGIKTLARNIAKSSGYMVDDALTTLVAHSVEKFATELAQEVNNAIEAANRLVTWREALVLEHHGIGRKTAKEFTMPEFQEFLDTFDHSDCPTNSWDEKRRQVKKGCPVAQKAYEESRS